MKIQLFIVKYYVWFLLCYQILTVLLMSKNMAVSCGDLNGMFMTLAECKNVFKLLSIAELENLIENLNIEEYAKLRQRYFEYAIVRSKELKEL